MAGASAGPGVNQMTRSGPSGKGPFKLHVLCWSHLDREWDFPFETTRVNMADILDEIMDVLEASPDYKVFHLDGQVVPLEDYLELRPWNRPRIERLTRAGRLLIGPWYALPEMNVIAGECIARNFLRGRQAAAPFGKIMKVGLSNTGWGQVSQMPQILRNFGIDTYMSYRGVPVEEIERECLWESPDGSRVILVRPSPGPRSIFFVLVMMPAHRYHLWREASPDGKPTPLPGARLAASDSAPLDPYFAQHHPTKIELEHVVRRVPKILATLEPDATTRHLWLGNWQDSMHPHPRLLEVVAEFRRHLPPGYRIFVSSLPDYVAALKRERRGLQVQVRGELRTPRRGGDAAEMMNVLSTRTDLKIANREAELALIYGADLWAAVAAATGLKHPREALDRAWKLLLVNHSHDTIGGVGIDRIHEDQSNRFARVGDLARMVQRQALAHLVRRVGFTPSRPGESGLTAFNPLPFERSVVAECSVDVPAASAGRSIRILDARDREAPFEVLASRRLDTKVYTPYDRYGLLDVQRYRVRVRFEDVPACGWASYAVLPAEEPPAARPAMPAGADWMENRFLRVKFNPDGTFDVRSKAAGRTFKKCGWYEDTGNVWDGWGYQPPAKDLHVTSLGRKARVRRAAHSALQTTFRVESVLRVPAAANAERNARVGQLASIPICSEITLQADSPVLRVKTTLTNAAKDHRLRVMFPSIPGAIHSWAEAPYDVIKRPVKVPDSTGWEEPWQGTHPMLNFADVSDGRAGLAVLPRGLCEFEVLENAERTLAVTLIRAFAHRHPRLKNTLSPEIKASQCLGAHAFEYGLYPHKGDWEAGEVARAAHDLLVPLAPVQHFGTGLPGSRRQSFLTVSAEQLVLHAVKMAEKGRALIVRLGNPTGCRIAADLGCALAIRKAALCNMAEEPLKRLGVGKDNRVRVELAPGKVVTVRLETGR